MSRRSRRAGREGAQLALGLEPVRWCFGAAERGAARLDEAARLLADVGYDVAGSGRGRYRLTVEAALRDWTLVLEERDGALVARAYVMRAPSDDDARARILEAILGANAASANARFALDAASVVVDATFAAAGSSLGRDALRAAVAALTRTCNDAYPQLLALAFRGEDDLEDAPLVLRVA